MGTVQVSVDPYANCLQLPYVNECAGKNLIEEREASARLIPSFHFEGHFPNQNGLYQKSSTGSGSLVTHSLNFLSKCFLV